MKIDLKRLTLGALLLVSPAGCRKDLPPKIELCQFDGYGGADCILKDGTYVYKVPSELKNFLGTNPDDQAAFAAWCYGATPAEMKAYYERTGRLTPSQ